MKKLFNKRRIFQYLRDQLTGNFAGFLIGMSATSLVSHFFETRSLRNLWGLTAHKKVLAKETFSNLEWIFSIVIGFVVFEIMTKVVKERIIRNYPRYKFPLLRWILRNQLHVKLKTYQIQLRGNRIMFFGAVFQGVKQACSRFQGKQVW